MPHEKPPPTQTILVVDDNPSVLKTVVDILEFSGFSVLAAQSGKEALLVAADHPGTIHLLLSDVDMPHMTGPALGRELKRLRPQTRVMLMSGGGIDGNLLVLNYGWAFIEKPFLFHRLVEMVRAVLATPDRTQSGGDEFDSRRDHPPQRADAPSSP